MKFQIIKNNKPFSYKNSQERFAPAEEIESVIQEDKNEHNDSRNNESIENDSMNNQLRKINLFGKSRSSQSLMSNNSGGLFKMNKMQSIDSNEIHANNEDNVFKRRGPKLVEKSSISSNKLPSHPSSNSIVDPHEREDYVPLSPDARMRRKRRQRANEIANNPLMLKENNDSSNQASSPNFSNDDNCIKMNMWFKRSEESEYDPEQSYRRPKFEYDFTPYESIYKVDDREGNMKKVIEGEAMKFDQKYSINNNNVFVTDIDKLSVPTFTTIFEQVKSWTSKAKMESEIPVIALIYIERLMKKAGILINENNWSRIVMTTLWVASKIWDDDSLENEHFAKVLNGVSLKEISILEKVFLGLVDYEVMITSKQFAKYSLILSSFCNKDQSNVSSPKRKKIMNKFESERIDHKFMSKINKA